MCLSFREAKRGSGAAGGLHSMVRRTVLCKPWRSRAGRYCYHCAPSPATCHSHYCECLTQPGARKRGRSRPEANAEGRMMNAECRMTENSEAAAGPIFILHHSSFCISTSHPQNTPRHTPKPSGRQPVGTQKPPREYPENTLRIPSEYPEATTRLGHGPRTTGEKLKR